MWLVMSYSQEEIEKKRLLALQRKKEAQTKYNNTIDDNKYASTHSKNVASIFNSHKNIENREDNVNRSHNYSKNKYQNPNRKFQSRSSLGNVNKQKDRFNPISVQNFFGQKQRVTGNCCMITEERFCVDTSSYFPPIIETFKTIPSRAYDMKSKTWNFHIKDYEILMEKIIQFKSDVQVIGLPKTVHQIFKSAATSVDHSNLDLSDIDSTLLECLMPFQREGICFGISKVGRCMIADDMGLGKTIQALGIAHHFRHNWPLLIVVPSSVRYQWAEAIFRFLPSLPTHYVYHFKNTKDVVENNKIVITSYDLLARAVDAFEKRFFGFIILDESHVLKDSKTARYKAVNRIACRANHVLLLSGTPALSRPIELYSQIHLVMARFMGYQEYGIRYCSGEKTSYGWDFTGSSNMQELQLLLKRTCMIRRLKSDVLNQLPRKKREVVFLDPDLIKVGTAEMVEWSKKLEGNTLSGVERHNTLLQYYNQSGIAKKKAICDYVAKLFKDKRKCLVFAHHRHILDAICQVADSMNIKYIRIDGKTNPEQRKYVVDQFQTCNDCLAAVLSITAANSGITLTAAQLVVFAELFWNPGILCQAEDRAHRIGQNDNVLIQYLVGKQTADDYIWPMIHRKMNVLNEAGLEHDFSLKDLSVTNQILKSGNQRTLNSYMNNTQLEDITDEITVESDKSTIQSNPSQSNSSVTTEDFTELLEFSEEDINFGDWDDMA